MISWVVTQQITYFRLISLKLTRTFVVIVMMLFVVFASSFLILFVNKADNGVFGCVEELLHRIDASEFGYTAFNGPATWRSKWPRCGGARQSPVMLDTCNMNTTLPNLFFKGHADYRPAGFRLHNTFQSVEVQFSGEVPSLSGGPFGSDKYTMTQIHFHWGSENSNPGSEHSFKGAMFSLEAHIVHYNSKYADLQNAANYKDGLVVVALLFQAVEFNTTELSSLMRNLQYVREGGSYTLVTDGGAMMWLRSYVTGGAGYLTYSGSLTTTPCTQSVTWVVLENTSRIGKRQIDEFRKLKGHVGPMMSNRRPLQPLGDRVVMCSRGHAPFIQSNMIYQDC